MVLEDDNLNRYPTGKHHCSVYSPLTDEVTRSSSTEREKSTTTLSALLSLTR